MKNIFYIGFNKLCSLPEIISSINSKFLQEARNGLKIIRVENLIERTLILDNENTRFDGKNVAAFLLEYEKSSNTKKDLYRIWEITFNVPPIPYPIVIEKWINIPFVEFVQQQYEYKLHAMPVSLQPNDPQFIEQYGMKLTKCEDAWAIMQMNEDVIVGIIDTGVDHTHNDISISMNSNLRYNVFDGSNDSMDSGSHGTAVAGVIGAITNNGAGVAGVVNNRESISPKISIMAIKAIGRESTDKLLARAISWAVDHGAKVINNSWGPIDDNIDYPVIQKVIDHATENGAICVFSAGNEKMRALLDKGLSDQIPAAFFGTGDARPSPPVVVDDAGNVAFVRHNGRVGIVRPDGTVLVTSERLCNNPIGLQPAGDRKLVVVCRDGTIWMLGSSG